jgi:hypothetical protein
MDRPSVARALVFVLVLFAYAINYVAAIFN